jgi:PAS domain S-box-containing protein
MSGAAEHSRMKWVAEALAVAAAYVVAATLRFVFPFTEQGASWVWLPSGVALAALLLRGRSLWPGVAVGAFLSSVLADHTTLVPAFVAAVYAPAEALIATAIIARRGAFDLRLETVGSVMRLLLAAVVAAAATAIVGAWNVTTLAGLDGTSYPRAWIIFFVGDALGMVAVTPPLLVWIGSRVSFQALARRFEFAALLASTLCVGALIFTQAQWPVQLMLPVAYLTFPLMVWGAFRFGQPGVTAVSTLLGVLALAGSARGLGPFGQVGDRGEATLLAAFMNVVTVTALIVAAVVQERARAQTEHRATEARFRAFMRFSPAIAYMKSPDGRYVYGNEAWARQFNTSPPVVLGKTDAELWPAKTAAQFHQSDLQVLERGQPIEVTQMGEGADGTAHWWSTLKFPVETPAAPLIGGITVDVTPRMRAELALRASEDRYRSLVELAGSVIVVVGADGRIVEWNLAAEAFFGISRGLAIGSDYLGTCVPQAQQEQVRADFTRILEGESVHERETHVPSPDGTRRSFLWNATRLREAEGEGTSILIIGQDISELRRLEKQLLLSQRMEGIGRLAGGIAHDFNNLLTAILGHAEMARTDTAPGDPALGNIAEITRAAQRAADLTRQLLAFARRQIIEPRIVDLNQLVLNVDRMLRRLLGEDVELVTVPQPGLWRVRIDPGQFEQVLVNLAVNARDAMPEGGRLVVETSNVVLDAEFARSHTTVQPGPHVLLAVSDTGVGMDPDVQAHIFEPFFTTKEVGKGTGLGLATCYGIVKQNRGSIWVHSEKGHGTTFRIYMPCAEAVEEPHEPIESAIGAVAHGDETVLLVEDELVVRDLAADALRRQGYQVVTAANGPEALDLVRRALRPFDVLVSDMVMPQMSGQQLADILLAQQPMLKVLFISGYSDLPRQHDSVLRPGVALLTKPFTPGQLVQRVRALLDVNAGPWQAHLPLPQQPA